MVQAGSGARLASSPHAGPSPATEAGRARHRAGRALARRYDGHQAGRRHQGLLAWRVSDRFEFGTTVTILQEAARGTVSVEDTPTLVADGGVENINAGVDELIETGLLRRVVALKDVMFSNSMIEAWWRTLKYQWLFLNALDSCATVRPLVAFYVAAHNAEIPHSAFKGQTPDEMYYRRGAEVSARLEAGRENARTAR